MNAIKVEKVILPITVKPVEAFPETGLFRHLSNHVSRSPEIQKYISYEGHHFFENVQN